MPKYEPKKWNDRDSGGKVQDGNNCYDYTIDRPSKNPKPGGSQPGRKGGKPLPRSGPITCDQVMKAAEADGFDCGCKSGKPITKDSKCPEGCWKVALVLEPARDAKHTNDFHWYRQDDDGKWSHKIGAGKATNKDVSNKEITDAETADRGKYKKFCGYCCVCPKNVEVAFLGPTEGEVFASLTLKEPAVLASRSMELALPAGRLSIVYGEEVKPMPTQETSVTVYVQIYSGRENPHWALSTEQLEILRSKLVNLPQRETEPPSGFGYQGFIIHNPGNVLDIPIKVCVFDGAIDIWDGKSRALYEDPHQLEQWLLTQACFASFGHDVELVIEEASGQNMGSVKKRAANGIANQGAEAIGLR